VLQKCIGVLRPQESQFIIDELRLAGISKAARHRFGCRVLQRLLEHCTAQQLQEVVEELLLDASVLCNHIYGHYVLQHLLEHGSDSQVQRLSLILIGQMPAVATDIYGVAVVGTALSQAGPEEQASLVSILLSTPGLLLSMASSRHGHLAAKQALVHAQEKERRAALLELAARQESLKSSRYGRVFGKFVAKCCQGDLTI